MVSPVRKENIVSLKSEPAELQIKPEYVAHALKSVRKYMHLSAPAMIELTAATAQPQPLAYRFSIKASALRKQR
jgi:hypothetical protein